VIFYQDSAVPGKEVISIMISHEYKCIFIHIPKCGGTSIEDIIWPEPRKESDLWMGLINKYENKYQTGGLQHLLGTQIRKEVGDVIYDNYYKFSIVRNPWDKIVSQYTHTLRRSDIKEFLGMKKNDSFKIYLERIQKRKHVQWEPQYNFVHDENGELIVDFLGRFENFEKDALTALNHAGIEVTSIPHSMKSQKRRPYVEYFDSESKEIIEELYKQDINTFGYTFD
jgi:hypothetical protein